MILFIPLDTFWRVGKLYGFGKNFLGTLGDALRDTIIPIPKLFVQKSDLVVLVCVYSGFFNTMKHSSRTCSRKTDFKYDQIVSARIPPVTARN